MEAMQENTIDVVKRMKEITQVMKTPEDVLQSQGVTPENIEGTVWSVSIIYFQILFRCYKDECLPIFFLQICWMSYKSMLNPLTWQMVRIMVELDDLPYRRMLILMLIA